MSIAFKEGLKIPPPALNEIILASNHDVRQVGNTGYEIPDQIVLLFLFFHLLRWKKGSRQNAFLWNRSQ